MPGGKFIIAGRLQVGVAISGSQLRFRRQLSNNVAEYCEIPTSLRSSE